MRCNHLEDTMVPMTEEIFATVFVCVLFVVCVLSFMALSV